MPTDNVTGIVETAWLAERLRDETLIVVDATWYMPGSPRTGYDDYVAEHIPGAVFWDVDAISDPAAPLPVTIPPPDQFAAHMTRLGIAPTTQVVVYDGSGIMSAARVWWMLRYFGHDAVAVLNGGMPKWKAEGRALETGEGGPMNPAGSFKPRPRSELLARFEDMMAHVVGGHSQVLDARGAARFRGEGGETRPNTRSGHMPGALNLPYGALLASDKTMLSPKMLAEKFAQAGLETDRPVVVSCGSGVSSPVLALGLFLTGRPDAVVYDGSWNEWGAHPDAPVVKD